MNGWTPERRQRQAELIRNWQPWRKSSGPRTAAGKAIAAQNVVVGRERRQRELQQAYLELAAAVAKIARLTSRQRECI